MESATEKIFRLLLVRKSTSQVELARQASCSKAFVSKLAKKLEDEKIIAMPSKRELLLLSPSKLLLRWAGQRSLPKPVYIKSKLTKEQAEQLLKKESSYCLTLFSGAWHLIKFMRTTTLEAYAPSRKIPHFTKLLGKRSRQPTKFILFPADSAISEGCQELAGLKIAAPVQVYVDLIAQGGAGPRLAAQLAAKYGLLE